MKINSAVINKIALFLFNWCVAVVSGEGGQNKREITLVSRLLESEQYDERIRPHFPYAPTNVTLGFSVLTIEDLQIEDMAFTLEIFLMQEWVDPRLRHNYEPFLDGSNSLNEVWIPDTYFRETTITDKKTQRQFEEKKSLLRIYPDGRVYYSTKESLRLSCGMDLKMFPIDVQRCHITIESYAYGSSEVIYKWQEKSQHFYVFKNKSLSHYEIDPMERSAEQTKDHQGIWSKLRATITFRRKSSAFIPAMYFPCTVIVIVSWITFFIHPDHFPARTNLCAVSVLTIITLQGGLNSTLPKVSYVKVIDMYVMGCVLFVSGAFVEYALVLLLKHKKKRLLKRKEQKKLQRIRQTGDVDLYRDEAQDVDIISKGNKGKKFYMKDHWPLILDEYSRLFFPFAFVTFNAVYWVYAIKYSHILSHSSGGK